MPSEVDPLLPRNESAPEITGYGFSTKQKHRGQEIEDVDDNYRGFYVERDNGPANDDDDDRGLRETTSSSGAGGSLSSFLGIFIFIVLFAMFISIGLGAWGDQPQPEPVPKRPSPGNSMDGRVAKILGETPLIDGHNDLAIFLRYSKYRNQLHTATFKKDFEKGGMGSQVDLPRLRSGKVGGSFWSAFVLCPPNALDFSDANYAIPTSETFAQIDLIRRLQSLYPAAFSPATSSLTTALSAFHANRTLISPISIEGLHQLPQSAPLSTLRLYHTLGVRAATLTWNCHNAFFDAAAISDFDNSTGAMLPPVPARYFRGGITKRGRAVIKEMNRLGMLIDLSHTSYWTQLAVLSNATSRSPVIYSHSSAFALCQHPRNVHDDILRLVKSTNSVVMVNFSPDFISCHPPPNSSVLPELYPANNTLHQIARHITYIGNLIGYEHVGLGSDFDGMGSLAPKGLEDVSKYPDLVKELLEMGVNDTQAAGVVGGNVLRVWKEAEKVSRQMRAEGVVEGEDEVEVPEWAEEYL